MRFSLKCMQPPGRPMLPSRIGTVRSCAPHKWKIIYYTAKSYMHLVVLEVKNRSHPLGGWVGKQLWCRLGTPGTVRCSLHMRKCRVLLPCYQCDRKLTIYSKADLCANKRGVNFVKNLPKLAVLVLEILMKKFFIDMFVTLRICSNKPRKLN